MGLLFGWIIDALIVGAIANSQHKSFRWAFIGSLFLSPIIGLIIFLINLVYQVSTYSAKNSFRNKYA